MLLLLVLLFFAFVSTNKSCPNPSIPSYKNNSTCYFLYNNKTDFIDAEGICKKLGGHLTSIHDMFENLFLSEKASKNFTDNDDFWIGANDLITVGNWSWIDNTVFDFSDWDKGQPQNSSNCNCGSVLMQDGKWKTGDCFKQKSFICLVNVPSDPSTTTSSTTTSTTITAATAPAVMTTTTLPKACSISWTFYNFTGFCYKVFDNSSWQDAEDRCKIDNAHLASIHSFEEAEFVADLAHWPGADDFDGTKQAWFGLYTEDDNAHWLWTDGTPFDYYDWVPGNPDNPGTENCCEIFLKSFTNNWKAGQFNNYPCNYVLSKFVCKKSPQ